MLYKRVGRRQLDEWLQGAYERRNNRTGGLHVYFETPIMIEGVDDVAAAAVRIDYVQGDYRITWYDEWGYDIGSGTWGYGDLADALPRWAEEADGVDVYYGKY